MSGTARKDQRISILIAPSRSAKTFDVRLSERNAVLVGVLLVALVAGILSGAVFYGRLAVGSVEASRLRTEVAALRAERARMAELEARVQALARTERKLLDLAGADRAPGAVGPGPVTEGAESETRKQAATQSPDRTRR
jgi:hypothetical protein